METIALFGGSFDPPHIGHKRVVESLLELDYIDKKINQTMLWMNGKPTHDHTYNECCFDFSCCCPELFEKNDAKRMERGAIKLNEFIKRRDEQLSIEE